MQSSDLMIRFIDPYDTLAVFEQAFAGVGLRTNVSELARQGWRPLIVGVVGECVIAVVTLVMVLAAARAFS